MLTASAAPSAGSVPAPSSSSRVRVAGPASSRMPLIRFIWPEKGRQALFDALLITDVNEIFVKNGRRCCSHAPGDQEPVLRHRVEQAGCFQRYGLAAGVRAGDDEGVIVAAQLNVHRHDLFLVDERVAGLIQLEIDLVADGGHKGVLAPTANRALASSRSILSIAS